MHCKEAFEYFVSKKTENASIFKIVLSNWSALTEVVNVLQVVYDATIEIQNPNFTLSDFYCCWIRIQMRLNRLISSSQLVTDLANVLLENLKKRKNALLKHPAMLCGIFLDPRIHKQLELESETEFMIAKTALANLNERICVLSVKGTQGMEANDSLDEYFRMATENDGNEEMKRRVDLMEALDHFHRSVPHLKIEKSFSIFDFWEDNKNTFPALYNLACVINAIPPSQATVERAFSTLKFVFGELRTRLDEDKLQNILMIKLNSDVAHQVNRNDLDKIKKQYSG